MPGAFYLIRPLIFGILPRRKSPRYVWDKAPRTQISDSPKVALRYDADDSLGRKLTRTEASPRVKLWIKGFAVTFRTKLFVLFMLALLLSVGAVAAGVIILTRRALDESNRRHSEALLGQFQRQFERRGQDVAHQVQAIADAEATVRMAIDLNRPQADVSVYVNDARGVSQAHQLDFLDFASNDGSIISSNELPSHFGTKMDWLMQPQDWAARGPFLARVDTQNGPALGLMSVSTVRVGDKDLYILGGARVGKDLLSSLVCPRECARCCISTLIPVSKRTI